MDRPEPWTVVDLAEPAEELSTDSELSLGHNPSTDTLAQPSPPAQPQFSQAQPWDRLPDEPIKWFIRFQYFRRLGPERNVLRAWKNWCREHWSEDEQQEALKHPTTGTSSSPTWYDAARKYDWESRATAFDEYQYRLDMLDEADERAQVRQERRAALRDLLLRAHQAIPEVDWSKASPSQVTYAVVRASSELRSDYEAEDRQAVSLKFILNVLPEELRTSLLSALRTNLESGTQLPAPEFSRELLEGSWKVADNDDNDSD